MSKKVVTINPLTRLEGHGKISIVVDENGNYDRSFMQVVDLRGFEKFCVGLPAEEMPTVTSRICGVCPTAHHLASTKALDSLYRVDVPPAAGKLRELMNSVFMVDDHTFHFFFLGGPDFIMGPRSSPETRNVVGLIEKLGKSQVEKVIAHRKACREIMGYLGGKPVHPAFGVPGGVLKGIESSAVDGFLDTARQSIAFAQQALGIFEQVVLGNDEYRSMLLDDAFKLHTYYAGMVDSEDRMNLYDGTVKVIDPDGNEFGRFTASEYLDNLAEHVEPWSYSKFCYLKKVGWKGFVGGKDSGVFQVSPIARLNVCSGMATPLAQKEFEKMYSVLGTRPSPHILASHWARLIELLYAAERMKELLEDPDITSADIRNIPTQIPSEGVGAVEAPRGLLIHHYRTDDRGLIEKANLIVATQNNLAAMNAAIGQVAQSLIKPGEITEGALNTIEMAYRAYDPCLSCSAHMISSERQASIGVYDSKGALLKMI